MTTRKPLTSTPERLAALGGVIAPTVFVATVLTLATLTDGYSHLSQKVSELGGAGAQFPLVQNLNFIVGGVLIIGFAWSLARRFGRPYVAAMLIGFFGASSWIANGILPCDTGCLGASPVGLAHNLTGFVGFVAALVGMFLFARRWRSDDSWRSHFLFTRVAAAVGSAGLLWFVVTQAMDAQEFSGLAQRVFIAALLAWMTVTGVRLYREGRAVPVGQETHPGSAASNGAARLESTQA